MILKCSFQGVINKVIHLRLLLTSASLLYLIKHYEGHSPALRNLFFQPRIPFSINKTTISPHPTDFLLFIFKVIHILTTTSYKCLLDTYLSLSLFLSFFFFSIFSVFLSFSFFLFLSFSLFLFSFLFNLFSLTSFRLFRFAK